MLFYLDIKEKDNSRCDLSVYAQARLVIYVDLLTIF